jgi:hypothetical protein
MKLIQNAKDFILSFLGLNYEISTDLDLDYMMIRKQSEIELTKQIYPLDEYHFESKANYWMQESPEASFIIFLKLITSRICLEKKRILTNLVKDFILNKDENYFSQNKNQFYSIIVIVARKIDQNEFDQNEKRMIRDIFYSINIKMKSHEEFQSIFEEINHIMFREN